MHNHHNHPLFSRWYNFVTRYVENSGYGEIRRRVLADARGRLLMIGIGPGYDLAHVPHTVTEVVGIDPDPTMRRIAQTRAKDSSASVQILNAAGESLPFPDQSFSSVLCALVLCSVDDPAQVLSEVRRVLTTDGRLLVLEHIRAPTGSSLSRWQDRMARPWAYFGGGCKPNCDTGGLLEQAGFANVGMSITRFEMLPPLIRPHLVGTAVPSPSRRA